MSLLLPTDDAFRPDRPAEIDLSRLGLVSALAHAAAGYPVAPLIGKRVPHGGGRMRAGTTDPAQIHRWWQDPRRGVGIVLDGLGLVVLDVDGPEGERSLARLAGPGGLESLPPTYEVKTSKGRHLYYRTPPGVEMIRSQMGRHHGRPELDIKLTWLMVVPGSTSASGHLYTASWDCVPGVEELPYVPAEVWGQIEERAQRASVDPAGTNRSDGNSRSVPVRWGHGTRVVLEGSVGQRLERLLSDVSDGRDPRVFEVVLFLLRRGVAAQDVWATLVDSPLGAKVRRQPDPMAYFAHKVASARACIGADIRDWDRDGWLQKALRSRLGDAEVRVMAYLWSQASPSGVVSMGSAKIGRGSALSDSQVGIAVKRLKELGWVSVLREHDARLMRPRVLSLEVPQQDGQNPDTASREAATLPPLSNRVRELTWLAGHDAFRSSPASLGKQFRLLGLVADGVASTEDFQRVLGCAPRTLDRHLERLVRSRLVTAEAGIYSLSTGPLAPLLDEVARAAGTDGAGERQWLRYLVKCVQNKDYRRRMAIVGTKEWREAHVRDEVASLSQPNMQFLLDRSLTEGWTLREVAEMQVTALEATYEATVACFRDFDWALAAIP